MGMFPFRMKRRRRVILLVLLLIYAGVITFGGCADTFLLDAPAGHRDAGSARRHFITVDGKALEIWTARPAGQGDREPEGFVLEFCGKATRAEQITQYVAERWKRHAIEAWVMNYPGYGGSGGGAHLKLIPKAALATYDELAKVAHGRPIFLAGASLGSTSALYVAANRPCAGVVLQNPPPLQRLLMQHYGWWNLWLVAGPVTLQVPAELNSLRNAPNVHVPAVIVTADEDTTIPPKYHKMVIDAYAGEKRVIAMHGGHNDSVSRDAEVQLRDGIDWLWESAREAGR
jgi:uncharacterized protein